MPELPEVETVCRGLQQAIAGAHIKEVVLKRADLRTPFPPNLVKTLAEREIISVSRRAKYLLFELSRNDTLIVHLGMSGRFSVCHPALDAGSRAKHSGRTVSPRSPLKAGMTSKHDHVIITLNDGRVMIYNDPRRFGLMDVCETSKLTKHKLFAHLGPEPLDKNFNAGYLEAALKARKTAIKIALMNQELVVGVGNIYASEALFLAGIDPQKPAHKAASKADLLVKCIRKVLRAAIESGGSSLRDFLHVSGEAGYFQHQFNVYGREGEPCFMCDTPIIAIRQAGRSTFYCKRCQH